MLVMANNAKNYASAIYQSLSKKRPSTNQSLASLKLCFYPCTHWDFCSTARAFLKIRENTAGLFCGQSLTWTLRPLLRMLGESRGTKTLGTRAFCSPLLHPAI